MKILFSGYLLRPTAGGGNISALTLLKRLAQKHEVAVLGISSKPLRQKQLIDGVSLYEWVVPSLLQKRLAPYHLRLLFRDILAQKYANRVIAETDPDLILIEPQTMVSPPPGCTAASAFFVRHYNFGPYNWYPSWWQKIYNKPFDLIRSNKNRKVLRKQDLVLANSRFMAKSLGQFGLKAQVVYPFIDLSRYKVQQKNEEFILFVNPQAAKGIEIVLSIAGKLPQQRFLIVGAAEQQMRNRIISHDNIEFRDWCDDMRDVYKETRIALVPSVWQEPFGRIPVEAGISGIPSIASARGGLPESVGQGGILIEDIWNIEEWTKAIRRLDDPEIYRDFSAKATENARRFEFDRVFLRLKHVVDSSLDLPEKL